MKTECNLNIKAIKDDAEMLQMTVTEAREVIDMLPDDFGYVIDCAQAKVFDGSKTSSYIVIEIVRD